MKRMKNLYFWYVVAGLFLLGLYSKYLVPGDYLIAGHDSGMPLNAFEFLRSRLQAWDDRVGFGMDNAPLFGSLTLHFVDYLSAVVVGTQYAGNWFNVFFWLSAIFLAAFVLGQELKDRLGRYFPVIFPPLVVFNFYIFQSIFILERAKYSIFTGLLLFLVLLHKFLDKKLSLFRTAVLVALTFTLFNGGSLLGLPLYGSVFVTAASVLLITFLHEIPHKKMVETLRVFKLFLTSSIFFVILNSYQILPYLPGVVNKSYTVYFSSKVLVKSIDWVNFISQGTSFLNLFRLQGVPAWFFDSKTPDPSHPYAEIYMNSETLILASALIPLLAFGAFLLKNGKNKRIVDSYTLMALVAMVFAAGTQEPFGQIYKLFYEHLPGFSIFRTPYYKFAGALVIPLCVLIAYTASRLADLGEAKIGGKKGLGKVVGLVIVASSLGFWLSYHHPLLERDNVMSWKRDGTTLIQPPSYISSWGDFLNKNISREERILMVPPLDQTGFSDSYQWGYWSLSPVSYSLISSPTLIDELGLTDEERGWVEELYESVEKGDAEKINTLTRKLAVSHILVRKDADNPKKIDYESAITGFSTKTREEGLWSLHALAPKDPSRIEVTSFLSAVPSKQSYLSRLFVEDQYSTFEEIATQNTVKPLINKSVLEHECQSCKLEPKKGLEGIGTSVMVLPNSPLYKWKELKERELLENTKDKESLKDVYLGLILRRSKETKTMLDTGTFASDDIAKNVRKINEYTDTLSEIIGELITNEEDFEKKRQVADILRPIETTMRGYVIRSDFASRPPGLKKEILDLLWRLKNIDEKYKLEDTDRWSTEKVYQLKTSKSGSHSLLINKETMPGFPSETIFPTSVILETANQKNSINLDESEDWIQSSINLSEDQPATLRLLYAPLPNRFAKIEESQQSFPSGKRGCTSGKIQQFANNRIYEVVISADIRSQKLSLFFNETNDPKEFFKADEIYIDNASSDKPFKYIYKSLPNSVNPTLYLCTNSTAYPSYDDIVIREVFSPQVITRTLEEHAAVTSSLKMERINSTRYNFTLPASTSPQVVVFKERYNALWQPKSITGEDVSAKHILIDGYANGWIFDPGQEKEVVLEYLPQKLFHTGSLMSLLTAIALAIIYVYKK